MVKDMKYKSMGKSTKERDGNKKGNECVTLIQSHSRLAILDKSSR